MINARALTQNMEDKMKLRNKIAIALSTAILASAASAAQIDFRHEWRSVTYQEASRVKLGTGFKINNDWKTNVGIEMKFASYDKTKTFEDVYLTETELDLGATYKINKNWQFKPGMPIAMTDRKITFKPQVRMVYKADMGLTTALRYRHEFANYSDPTDGDTDMETGEKVNNPQKSKVTLTGSYKIKSLPNLKLSYEANYVKSHNNVKQFDGKDSEYDAGLIVGYQLGNWRPYGEIWDIDQSSSTADRQLKYRLGIKYKF